MIIAKQMEIRSNIKKYFDLAYGGTAIIVPRKENKNVVIISEDEYNRLNSANRMRVYSDSMNSILTETPDQATLESDHTDVKSFNLAKLQAISGLAYNWNGNGAPAFPKGLIMKVHTLLNDLDIQPQIFPTALMTIQLEYDNSRRDHLEIDIDESDIAEIFYVTYDGHEAFDSISATADSINERVKNFYG